MSNEKVINRWFAVFGAVLIQLCLGAIYAWSVFTPTLMQAGWSKMQTQIVFAVGLAMFAASMVFAGKKLAAWGPRKLSVICALVLGCGYILAGLFGGTNFILLTILIGVVSGAGIGLGYVVPIAVGMRWFPDKKGFITGLSVAGFGFGAMGWVKLAGSWGGLIASMGMSTTFIVYGVAFVLLILAGSLWMVFPPEGWAPEGFTPEKKAAVASGREYTTAEMLASPRFYLIVFTFAVSAGAGLMAIGLMKLYPMEALQAAGYSTLEASAIAGTAMAVFFSLANGIGRIAWGAISDKLGRKTSILIMTGVQGMVMISFTAMAGNESMLYLGATLIGFNYGGIFALFPAVTADTFGAANVGKNYPYVFIAYGIGGIAGPILGGLLGDMNNFPLAFSICGAACLAGAAATLMIAVPKASASMVPEKVKK